MTKKFEVKSSAVNAITYNRTTRIMGVAFKSGGCYVYEGVSPRIFAKVRKSESVGKALHEHILGKFESRKVEE